jgi:hypothetical protein
MPGGAATDGAAPRNNGLSNAAMQATVLRDFMAISGSGFWFDRYFRAAAISRRTPL